MADVHGTPEGHNLSGVTVLELGEELTEYCGLVLAGLGAEVIRLEPEDGTASRRFPPFLDGVKGPERSLHFWSYNRGKRSVVLDPATEGGADAFRRLLARCDVLLESTPGRYLDRLGLGPTELTTMFPHLVAARMTPFGDEGPWADYRSSDLVHLALGGPVMNCGYDPDPSRHYDLPPIAAQLWHSLHIAGDQLAMMTVGALIHRSESGRGQHLTLAVHEAVSKSTELDLMNWIMRRQPLVRQTCRHAMEKVSPVQSIVHTKDGRWVMIMAAGAADRAKAASFLARYGLSEGIAVDAAGGSAEGSTPARNIPGSASDGDDANLVQDRFQRLFRQFTYREVPWLEAQEAGLLCAPLRLPHENLQDGHWWKRGTFSEIEHPEFGRSFAYPTRRWASTEAPWKEGRRAPLLGEDTESVLAEMESRAAISLRVRPSQADDISAVTGCPWALRDTRVVDFGWFLATAGATRFLAALGAECIKIEWKGRPDTRIGAQYPVGGREARRHARAPMPGVDDPDMGGQFFNKNPGKRGISLNVGHPKGAELVRQLVAVSDVVSEGFSPGVMDRFGLGYDGLKAIKSDIIYASQSGMGLNGDYGRMRAIGPIAAALAGTSEMSGLPSPAMPAGWGYSFLDWIAAYSFATAILAALYHRHATGRGQWIEASQVETGIWLAGLPILEWSANRTAWSRTGNRSKYATAAPHGIYRCAGEDRWIALECRSEEEWVRLTVVADRPSWAVDNRFDTLGHRLANEDALDAELEQWTANEDGYSLMGRLQAAGIAAGVCQTAEDRCDNDPQLESLGWLREVTGTKIGTWPVAEVPVRMSLTPPYVGGRIDRGAPCYGEDNEYVYGELLGLSQHEISKLMEDGIV